MIQQNALSKKIFVSKMVDENGLEITVAWFKIIDYLNFLLYKLVQPNKLFNKDIDRDKKMYTFTSVNYKQPLTSILFETSVHSSSPFLLYSSSKYVIGHPPSFHVCRCSVIHETFTVMNLSPGESSGFEPSVVAFTISLGEPIPMRLYAVR